MGRAKSRIRIFGTDRALMMLCKDARKRWMQYATNRKVALSFTKCFICGKNPPTEADHEPPIGPRPRSTHEFSAWVTKLFHGPVNGVCRPCHLKKCEVERKKRQEEND